MNCERKRCERGVVQYPTGLLSPSGGEETRNGFMVPMRVQSLAVEASHKPGLPRSGCEELLFDTAAVRDESFALCSNSTDLPCAARCRRTSTPARSPRGACISNNSACWNVPLAWERKAAG